MTEPLPERRRLVNVFENLAALLNGLCMTPAFMFPEGPCLAAEMTLYTVMDLYAVSLGYDLPHRHYVAFIRDTWGLGPDHDHRGIAYHAAGDLGDWTDYCRVYFDWCEKQLPFGSGLMGWDVSAEWTKITAVQDAMEHMDAGPHKPAPAVAH